MNQKGLLEKLVNEEFPKISSDYIMDFNILEVVDLTEPQHTKIISWLFGNEKYCLKYKILSHFLTKVLKENKTNSKISKEYYDILQAYIEEISNTNPENIEIHQEYILEGKKIDIFIEDKTNNVVIGIENKIDATESENQLNNYRKSIEKKEGIGKKIYIFLTVDGYLPHNKEEQKFWFVASHNMIGQSIEELISNNTVTLSHEAKTTLLQYTDLLVEKYMMEDKLKPKYDRIWADYRSVLEYLNNDKENRIWETSKKELKYIMYYKDTNINILHNMIVQNFKFYKKEDQGIYWLVKTNGLDQINEYINTYIDTENTESRNFIDIQINNREKGNSLWIGYFCNKCSTREKDKILKKIYNNLFKDIKIDKCDTAEKAIEINKGKDSLKNRDIEKLSYAEIKNEANRIVEILRQEIKEFDDKTEKALKELQGQNP